MIDGFSADFEGSEEFEGLEEMDENEVFEEKGEWEEEYEMNGEDLKEKGLFKKVPIEKLTDDDDYDFKDRSDLREDGTEKV